MWAGHAQVLACKCAAKHVGCKGMCSQKSGRLCLPRNTGFAVRRWEAGLVRAFSIARDLLVAEASTSSSRKGTSNRSAAILHLRCNGESIGCKCYNTALALDARRLLAPGSKHGLANECNVPQNTRQVGWQISAHGLNSLLKCRNACPAGLCPVSKPHHDCNALIGLQPIQQALRLCAATHDPMQLTGMPLWMLLDAFALAYAILGALPCLSGRRCT